MFISAQGTPVTSCPASEHDKACAAGRLNEEAAGLVHNRVMAPALQWAYQGAIVQVCNPRVEIPTQHNMALTQEMCTVLQEPLETALQGGLPT
jgi:hypothetical protein